MIMAGLEYTGNVPFRHVYFTGIIRDKQGRKMSKSLGNSPDPLDLIAKVGADGLRFGLLRLAPQGQDIRFDEQQIVEGRNFCNKLWNACRFRTMQGPPDPAADPRAHTLTIFAADMLASLDAAIARIDAAYDAYRFNEVAQTLYDFVWGDFCDRFIEAAKADIMAVDSPRRAGTLAAMDFAISRILRLLHPYAPFVTEELWQGLGLAGGESIQFAPWPEAAGFAPEPRCGQIHEAAAAARNTRSTYNLPSNKRLAWILTSPPAWIEEELPALRALLNASDILLADAAPSDLSAAVPSPIGTLYLPLKGLVDVEAETQRLEGECGKVAAEIHKVRAKLSSGTFVQNAPADVVAEHRAREAAWIAKDATLREALANLKR
jgi:valyl-tRNA synthetase